MGRRLTWRRPTAIAAIAVLTIGALPGGSARSEDYQRISGEGSSWAGPAINAAASNVLGAGLVVDYNPSGSTSGRANFRNGTVDFAASDIPFQFHPEDGSAPETIAAGTYAYIPVVAGGTAFMYNLRINGQQVTNLRLSGENIAKIFTNKITMWNDPALVADNPGIVLPARPVVPVVRSDGSGSTAQFTMWMIDRHPDIWNTYCNELGRAGKCGFTSFYPRSGAMIAQNGDSGVANYVAQSFAEGAIGYVNYSYALGLEYPVAKVLNAAGYYTEPTPQNVAVSLLKAQINQDASDPSVYLTQKLDGVYADTDPRNYQLSSYSYFILPTAERGQFNAAKGKTVAAFAYYMMCEAQQGSESLGYSPMPINLVEASFEQIRKIPGADAPSVSVQQCNNPTFSPDGSNLLAETAPMPAPCDKHGIPTQCETGTGGKSQQPTPVAGGGSAYDPDAGGGGSGTGDGGTGAGDGGTGAGDGGTGTGDGGTGTGDGDPGAGDGDPVTGDGGTGGGDGGGGDAPDASSSTSTVPCASPTSTTATSISVVDSAVASTTTIDPCTTVPPATTAPAGSVVPETCDPDTGVCGPPTTAAGSGPTVAQLAAAAAGPVRPTTLDDDPGWGIAQTLMAIVVILLTLAIIVVPSLLWRRMATRGVAA